tara:strand:- start:36053 stop:36979 length:927 start_codon:yes stop_codon:yes gene_type:complete
MINIWACCLLALGQIAIAVNVVAGKHLIDVIPVHIYLCSRYLASTVFLSMFMLLLKQGWTEKQAQSKKFDKRDWLLLTLQAFTGGFLFNVLFFWGIQSTTAISAGIISSSLPAILAICAFFCLGEKIKKWKWMGIVLAMVGILVINLDNPAGKLGIVSFWGNFIILMAMIPEALYTIFNKFTSKRITTLGAATIVNFITFLMLVPFAFYDWATVGMGQGSFEEWMLLIFTGFANLFFFWFWAKGLIHIPASTAAIFTSVLPVATTLLAWAFLHETLGEYDMLGMSLVLLSIFIGTGWLPKLFARRVRA